MIELKLIIRTLTFAIFIPGTVIMIIPILISIVWSQQIDLEFLWIMGVALLGIGAIFYGYSVLLFLVIGKGTPMIYFMEKMQIIFGLEPEKIIKNGLYRYSRNPMYLGVVLLILGEGILFQLPIIILWSIVTFFSFHMVVCYLEEPHLRKKHQGKYDIYFKSTPRWIGVPKSQR